MRIQQITHRNLSETVAGRLVASILDSALKPGDQLPPERELMSQLGISRATLREALKTLGENKLIEARPGIGWFVRVIDQANVTQAHELARG
ncbi:MAG TPA: GntR family transcriptional regulator, partial [Anaerolineales bacterium]|nr:GntR family transcriptional regulator [Anaerolineales bacterium]